MAKKNKIQYGTKDVMDSHEYDPSEAKVMISIRIDGDVLNAYRKLAEKTGKKYQALMNAKLKEALIPETEQPVSRAEVEEMISIAKGDMIRMEMHGRRRAGINPFTGERMTKAEKKSPRRPMTSEDLPSMKGLIDDLKSSVADAQSTMKRKQKSA